MRSVGPVALSATLADTDSQWDRLVDGREYKHTHDQWQRFRGTLCGVCPSLAEWIENSSPNPEQTWQSWRIILADFDYQELMCVLADWLNNELRPYNGLADVPYSIRRSAMQARVDHARGQHQSAREEQIQQFQAAKEQTVKSNMAESMRAAVQLRGQYDSGEISESGYHEQLEQILDRVM